MTRAWAATACLALAACPGKKAEDKPAPRIDAAAKPVAMIDAAPPAPKPVDLTTLPVFPGAAPDGPVIVHAADADLGALQYLLARGANHVALSPRPQVVTGTIGPTTDAAALAAIGGALTPLPPGKGLEVDLDFRGVTLETLLRLLSSIERRNLVVAVDGPLPTLDIWIKHRPTGAVLGGATAALGLVADEVGGLTWLRRPDGPQLDKQWLTQKQPKEVDLDVVGARAGAIYALLVDLGVMESGAPCDAGPPITVSLKKASAGAVIATVASLSGVAPRDDAQCVPTFTVTANPQDVNLLGIARVGGQRVGLVAKGDDVGLAQPGGVVVEVADGFVALDVGDHGKMRWLLQLRRDEDAVAPSLDGARLAATVIDGDRSAAVFELADGSWNVVGASPSIRIEPGKVTSDQGVVVLSSR